MIVKDNSAAVEEGGRMEANTATTLDAEVTHNVSDWEESDDEDPSNPPDEELRVLAQQRTVRVSTKHQRFGSQK